jgi:Fe-S cluster biogenesis protein NfuA
MSIPTSVYAEMTPNPAVMKFVADRPLIEGGYQAELRTKEEAAMCSPLAEELFNFPFVTGVFISGYFVSVTKDESLGWEMIVQQLREYIREWLMEHPTAVDTAAFEKVMEQLAKPDAISASPSATSNVTFLDESEMTPSDYDDEIRHLLNEFVRPAVEQDGGAIDFKAFKDGKVYVHMRGACSGCPSSMQTLKGGIEQLLTSKLEAVEEVVALGV